MSQFGLYLHWHELAKIMHSEYKIAQKNNGNLASYQVMKMFFTLNYLSFFMELIQYWRILYYMYSDFRFCVGILLFFFIFIESW